MNQIVRDLLSCKVCNDVFNEPVILPCGETICAKHDVDFKDKNISCTFCQKHHVNTEPYPCNNTIQRLLDRHVHELDFGEEYKSAVTSLKNLKESIQNYESLKDNAEDYINEHFAKLRSQVDLKREMLIQKINDSSDKLLSEIAALEIKCKENWIKSGCNLFKAEHIARIKSDMCEREKSLEKLVVNEKEWKKINNRCRNNTDKLEKDLKVLEDDLLSGDLKREEIAKKFSNVESILVQNLVYFKEKLQFKLENLSQYDSLWIKNVLYLKSSSPTIIYNLPCRVEVKITPSKSLDQSEEEFGVYFSCAFLESIFENNCYELDSEFSIYFLSTSGKPVCKNQFTRTFSKANGFSWGLGKHTTFKQIMNDKSMDIYNKQDDSAIIEIEVQKFNMRCKD